MKVSDKIRQDGMGLIGRTVWGSINPVTRAVPPKKGKGSYSRLSFNREVLANGRDD